MPQEKDLSKNSKSMFKAMSLALQPTQKSLDKQKVLLTHIARNSYKSAEENLETKKTEEEKQSWLKKLVSSDKEKKKESKGFFGFIKKHWLKLAVAVLAITGILKTPFSTLLAAYDWIRDPDNWKKIGTIIGGAILLKWGIKTVAQGLTLVALLKALGYGKPTKPTKPTKPVDIKETKKTKFTGSQRHKMRNVPQLPKSKIEQRTRMRESAKQYKENLKKPSKETGTKIKDVGKKPSKSSGFRTLGKIAAKTVPSAVAKTLGKTAAKTAPFIGPVLSAAEGAAVIYDGGTKKEATATVLSGLSYNLFDKEWIEEILTKAEKDTKDWNRGLKKQVSKDFNKFRKKVSGWIDSFKNKEFLSEERKEFEKIQKDRNIPSIREKYKRQSSLFDHLDKPRQTALEQLKTEEGFGKGNIKGEIGFGKEGFRYKDTKGIDTIGYGFNLERKNAAELLKKFNIKKSLADLRGGKVALTEEEAERLMLGEYPYFRRVAMNFLGKDKWKAFPASKKDALTNMAYNMGEKSLNKFTNLRAALRSGEWEMAGYEVLHNSKGGESKYLTDVGKRAYRIADVFASPINPMEKSNAFNAQQNMNNELKMNQAGGNTIMIDKSTKQVNNSNSGSPMIKGLETDVVGKDITGKTTH